MMPKLRRRRRARSEQDPAAKQQAAIGPVLGGLALVILLALVFGRLVEGSEDEPRVAPPRPKPSATPTHSAGEWAVFESQQGGFRIVAPGPITEKKDVDDSSGYPLDIYQFELGDPTTRFSFTLYYFDLPGEVFSQYTADEMLGNVRDNFVEDSLGDLVEESSTSVQGNPCIDFVVREPKAYFVTRLCLVGRRLFEVAVGTHRTDRHLPEVERFIQSFRPIPSSTIG
jgi:hypothetical protein